MEVIPRKRRGRPPGLSAYGEHRKKAMKCRAIMVGEGGKSDVIA